MERNYVTLVIDILIFTLTITIFFQNSFFSITFNTNIVLTFLAMKAITFRNTLLLNFKIFKIKIRLYEFYFIVEKY